MRRCHSPEMSDYRRKDNEAMWDRPLLSPVVVPSPSEHAERSGNKARAKHNLERKILQAIKAYLDEVEPGQ